MYPPASYHNDQTGFMWPVLFLLALYAMLRFMVNGYSRAKASGKIIEGTIVDKGKHTAATRFPYFVKYKYTDASGQQKEKEDRVSNKAKWEQYQVSQRVELISSVDPTYLNGAKLEYVKIRALFDDNYAYHRKIIKYYPVCAGLILLFCFLFWKY